MMVVPNKLLSNKGNAQLAIGYTSQYTTGLLMKRQLQTDHLFMQFMHLKVYPYLCVVILEFGEHFPFRHTPQRRVHTCLFLQ